MANPTLEPLQITRKRPLVPFGKVGCTSKPIIYGAVIKHVFLLLEKEPLNHRWMRERGLDTTAGLDAVA
jgi:hypothetical protein